MRIFVKKMNMSLSRIFPALILPLILLFAGCEGNDIPSPPDGYSFLNYDGKNRDAPALPGNTYEGAARFPASRLIPNLGDTLEEVHFYIRDLPESCEVRIYSGEIAGAPDSLLYSADVSSQISAGSWNIHKLASPVPIEGPELWLAIRFSHTDEKRTLGCDPGPAVTNGDWLYDAGDGFWIPLSDRSQIDINWNIRGLVKN
jgi:hypothetical protein